MHRRPALCSLTALFTSLALPCWCQVLPLQSYTIKDGLASNQINALCQDSRGDLWIGTNNGLSVYDGTTFTTYSTLNGLPNNWVTTILESQVVPGTMWIGTIADGLCTYHEGRFTPVPLDSSDGSNIIGSIVEDTHGTIWCAAAAGLFAISHDSSILIQRWNPRQAVGRAMVGTSTGSLWVSNGDSVDIYADRNTHRTTFHPGLHKGAYVECMVPRPDGCVWVGSSDSLVSLWRDTTLVRRYKVHSGMAYSMEEDGKVLWLRTSRGLSEIPLQDSPASLIVNHTVEDLPPQDWAEPILVDRENNLWVGTRLRGLLKLVDRNLFRVPLHSASPGVMDRQGHFWTKTGDHLSEVYRDSNGVWQNHLHPLAAGAPLEAPRDIDRFGRLWITIQETPHALRCYRVIEHPGRASGLGPLLGLRKGVNLPDAEVMTSYVDKSDHVWLGLDNWTVAVYEVETGRHLRTYTQSEGVPGNSVRAILQDAHNNVWLGGWDAGLTVLYDSSVSKTAFRKFTTADGLPDSRIRSVHEDRDGRLWIGTRHGGLALYTGHGFQTVSMSNGLMSNSIWDIVEDDQNRLWLRTDIAVECINRTTLAVLRTKREFIDEAILSLGMSRDRFLYWSTADALALYDYTNDRRDTIPPLVHVNSFVVNGTETKESAAGALSYDQNNCTISYSGISFADEKEVRYRYRLLGVDTGWTHPALQRTVTYATLRPGSYVFQVRAFNRDGVASISPASFSFSILPPFWQRWWFLALAGVAFTVGIASVARYLSVQKLRRRVQELEKEQAVAEAQARTRDRIASDLHDDVASTLSSIAFFTESLKRQLGNTTGSAREMLHKISSLALEAEDSVGDIVWSVSPRHDSLQDLFVRMRDFGSDLCGAQGIEFSAAFDEPVQPVRLDDARRKNLHLIFKEAMHNVTKHARAASVRLELFLENGQLHLTLKDNGIGFAPSGENGGTSRGHGLRNMAKRAESLGARLVIDSSPGAGTTVRLILPMA